MLQLICLVIGHRRSRGRAQHDGLKWHSTCRRCGTAMTRDRGGRWRRARHGEAVQEAN